MNRDGPFVIVVWCESTFSFRGCKENQVSNQSKESFCVLVLKRIIAEFVLATCFYFSHLHFLIAGKIKCWKGQNYINTGIRGKIQNKTNKIKKQLSVTRPTILKSIHAWRWHDNNTNSTASRWHLKKKLDCLDIISFFQNPLRLSGDKYHDEQLSWRVVWLKPSTRTMSWMNIV